MAIATEQLEAINQEITQAFTDNPRITVKAVEGTPPDTYEVTYAVEGFQKSESGKIEKTGSHTVAISIPFGFPHFPPSCKPKSPIFHPDFDPAAICIGDFWEKNRSIVDLIDHIGEMITGAFYSTSNAFNEEAARWYEENLDQPQKQEAPEPVQGMQEPAPAAPLGDDITSLLDDDDDDDADTSLFVDVDTEDEDGIAPALSFVDEPEDRTEAAPADLSGDIFEESDFDFEAPPPDAEDEQEDLLPAGFNGGLEKEVVEEEVDIAHFQDLAREKRYFGLDKELSLLSADTHFDGRETLAEEAAVALEQAQSLYTRALEYEHKGEPDRALRCFKQISDYTTDYPGLQEDISRITQAMELLGDWTDPDEKEISKPPQIEDPAAFSEPEAFSEPARAAQASAEQQFGTAPPPPEPDTSKAAPAAKASRTFFDDGSETKSRLLPFTILIILLLVGAAGGIHYFLTASNFDKAAADFNACKTSLKRNAFTDAEQQCESALARAKQIKFLKTGERDRLMGEIARTLRSKPMQEGLAGNLPLDGEYFPRQVVQDIQTFRKFKTEGDKLFAASKWQQALSNYEQALTIAAKEESIDRQRVFEISENIKVARFRITYESARSYINRKKWVLATSDLNTALEQLKALDINDKAAIIDDITNQLSGIAQATEKEKGDMAFQESKWDKASSHYRKALVSANKAPNPAEDVIYELKQLIVKADLYNIISTGKSAFRKSQWDAAIDSYDEAITLLEDNRELLRQTNTEENRKKLARILLQASVIRDKQSAARHLKEHEYTEAVAKLQAVIDSVSASQFTGEQEFSSAVEEAKQSIEQAQTDRLMSDKISYLETNFEDLFTRHYSGSPPESLTERTVAFERAEGDLLIFRLQCLEVGHGRPLQLVMKYAHNLKTGTWRFYSDPQ